MKDEVENELILPSIRESEQYKKAINKRQTLSELGDPDVEHPFETLLAKIEFILQKQKIQ
jgi:chromosome partitioning protein